MAKISQKNRDLEAMWNSGKPMDSAWIDMADFFDRFAYRALLCDPDNDVDVLDVNHPRYKEINRGWLPQSWEGRQAKLKAVTYNERISLLEKIFRGQLVAIGFRTLADGSDELARVPRRLFFVNFEAPEPMPEIDWAKGEILGDGESYFDIRVAENPEDGAASEPNDAPSSRTMRKGGRPGTRTKIEAAAKNLLKDEDFRAKTRWNQAVDVRVAILGPEAANQHDRPGYKTETIKRIIGEIDDS